jgi:SNF2 family DNA or RNA helicase
MFLSNHPFYGNKETFVLLFLQALIFSQFMGTIDWLKIKLTEAGVKYRYISGDMPLNKRAKAIEQFQQVSSGSSCIELQENVQPS